MHRVVSRRELLRGIASFWAGLAGWLVGSRALGVVASGLEPAASTPMPTPVPSVAAKPAPAGAPPISGYDTGGPITRVSYPGTGTYTFVYDAGGNAIKRLDGLWPANGNA